MKEIWESANNISELGYKVHSTAMVVELVAASIQDNAESGACWCAVDCLTRISDEIDAEVAKIMSENRKRVRLELTLYEENKEKLGRLAKNALSRSHYLEAFIESQEESIDSPGYT